MKLEDEFFNYISLSKWIDNGGNLNKKLHCSNSVKWLIICHELAEIAIRHKIRTITEVIK